MVLKFVFIISLTLLAFSCTVTRPPVTNTKSQEIHAIEYKEQLLDSFLKNKRIVLLGEFTHGSREVNLIKNNMIRYLHEKLGYNIITLESGFGEIIPAYQWPDSIATSRMTAALIGPWRTREYIELFDYARKKKELIMTGFDPQKTSSAVFLNTLRRFKALDHSLLISITNAEQRFDSINRRFSKPIDSFIVKDVEILIYSYDRVSLQASQLDFKHTEHYEWFLQVLRNRIFYLEYSLRFHLDKNMQKRYWSRDSMMAKNIDWLLNHYPNEKIMISAHNYHVSKHNSSESVLGELLFAKYGDQVYSIGVYAGDGIYADNSRNPRKMSDFLEPKDIRNHIRRAKYDVSYINIDFSVTDSWLTKETIITHSFVDLVDRFTLVPALSFDGLLFIKRSSMPEY